MRFRLPVLVIVVAAATVVAAAPAGAPPAEVDARIRSALHFLDDDSDFVGSYLLTIRTDVDAPGDDGPEKSLEIRRVTLRADGTREDVLLRAEEDGVDVTEQKRADGSGLQVHGHRENGSEHDGNGPADDDLALMPVGENAALYRFHGPRRRDGVLVSRFEPTRAHRRDDDVARGEIAWSASTGDPAWIEFEPADLPALVSELTLRFDFDRAGDTVYPSRLLTRTKAGIPFLRVKVLVDITVTEVEPAS